MRSFGKGRGLIYNPTASSGDNCKWGLGFKRNAIICALRHAHPEGCTHRCLECSNVLKPDTTLFGEPIDPSALQIARDETLACDLLLVVGTSAHVAPASELPIVATNNGARVIELNLEITQLTYNRVSDVYVLGKAEVLLPALVTEVKRLLSVGR